MRGCILARPSRKKPWTDHQDGKRDWSCVCVELRWWKFSIFLLAFSGRNIQDAKYETLTMTRCTIITTLSHQGPKREADQLPGNMMTILQKYFCCKQFFYVSLTQLLFLTGTTQTTEGMVVFSMLIMTQCKMRVLIPILRLNKPALFYFPRTFLFSKAYGLSGNGASRWGGAAGPRHN